MLLDELTEICGSSKRYYDPVVGRFISEDPIRQASGTNNLQQYAGNNPINNADPSGHDSPSTQPVSSDDPNLSLVEIQLQILLAKHAAKKGTAYGFDYPWLQGGALGVRQGLPLLHSFAPDNYYTRWDKGWLEPDKVGFDLFDATKPPVPGLHVLNDPKGPYISASEFLEGARKKGDGGLLRTPFDLNPATGFPESAKLWYINKDAVGDAVVRKPEILENLRKLEAEGKVSDARVSLWSRAQSWEGEVLISRPVPASAVRSLQWYRLTSGGYYLARWTSRGLLVVAIVATAVDIGESINEGVKERSFDPVAHEVARQAGGWGGSLALGGLGAELGTALGPIGAFIGGIAGGIAGFFGGEALADEVYEDLVHPQQGPMQHRPSLASMTPKLKVDMQFLPKGLTGALAASPNLDAQRAAIYQVYGNGSHELRQFDNWREWNELHPHEPAPMPLMVQDALHFAQHQ